MTELKIILISGIALLVFWFLTSVSYESYKDTKSNTARNIAFAFTFLTLAAGITVIIFSIILIIKL